MASKASQTSLGSKWTVSHSSRSFRTIEKVKTGNHRKVRGHLPAISWGSPLPSGAFPQPPRAHLLQYPADYSSCQHTWEAQRFSCVRSHGLRSHVFKASQKQRAAWSRKEHKSHLHFHTTLLCFCSFGFYFCHFQISFVISICLWYIIITFLVGRWNIHIPHLNSFSSLFFPCPSISLQIPILFCKHKIHMNNSV